MRLLRFISTFIRIVIDGCMESNVARTIIVMLAGLAVGLFVPYWVGLLVTGLIFGFGISLSTPLCWSVGILTIICAVAAGSVLILIWTSVYDEIKR